MGGRIAIAALSLALRSMSRCVTHFTRRAKNLWRAHLKAQAISVKLADMGDENELARTMVYRAAAAYMQAGTTPRTRPGCSRDVHKAARRHLQAARRIRAVQITVDTASWRTTRYARYWREREGQPRSAKGRPKSSECSSRAAGLLKETHFTANGGGVPLAVDPRCGPGCEATFGTKSVHDPLTHGIIRSALRLPVRASRNTVRLKRPEAHSCVSPSGLSCSMSGLPPPAMLPLGRHRLRREVDDRERSIEPVGDIERLCVARDLQAMRSAAGRDEL